MNTLAPAPPLHLLHGAVPTRVRGSQSGRNYVATAALREYLTQRTRKYASLASAVGRDACLTVDDSTVGAAEACRLARKTGHDVTLFANPFQIETQSPYFFSIMDAALDHCARRAIDYEGETWRLDTPGEIRRLRLKVRARLMRLPAAEAEAGAWELARRLGVPGVDIPRHAQTMSRHELEQLRDDGVQIEAHGWDHQCISALDIDALERDLRRTQAWLNEQLGVASKAYAIPYGVVDWPAPCETASFEYCFLADATRPFANLGPRCWNRREITGALQQRQT